MTPRERMHNDLDNDHFPRWMSRTVQLLGAGKCNRLRKSHVLVAGLGGVGSMAAETLVRAGIGHLTIADHDRIGDTNINRQIVALHSTIGRSKAEVMKERLLDINPEAVVRVYDGFIDEEGMDRLFDRSYDFVVDAIDTLTPKILLIEKAFSMGLPLASSMGSGGRTDPSKITITLFEKTYNDRLAYLLRKKLRKRGIEGGFMVVFSTEQTDRERLRLTDKERNKKSVPGTVSYIPAIFGCMLTSIVVEGITGGTVNRRE